MKRSLRSSEVSAFLRKTLNLEEPVKGSDVEVVSSHSLKATLLAWCARYGLSPQTRSMLGRHSSCLAETFAIYSRDLVVHQWLNFKVWLTPFTTGPFFQMIKGLAFSGRMIPMQCHPVMSKMNHRFVMELFQFAALSTSQVLRMLMPEPSRMTLALMLVVNVALTTSAPKDSDSSSSGSDALSSDHSDVAEPPARVMRFRAKIPKEESWYVHSKSHLIHRFDGTRHNTMRFLVCGKVLTDAYALCTEATAWNTLCRSCNRR